MSDEPRDFALPLLAGESLALRVGLTASDSLEEITPEVLAFVAGLEERGWRPHLAKDTDGVYLGWQPPIGSGNADVGVHWQTGAVDFCIWHGPGENWLLDRFPTAAEALGFVDALASNPPTAKGGP